ncbi:hypothetical protein K0M31_016461 [Melipona bicolor]|uniref:Uncharacterized protein n=1 Tax=Melipona bicolor TaxID=60889 RepID=A0AA40G7G5_9HYME|nr:hypothetical protein K0M31_016461 [Melipona bicolor]
MDEARTWLDELSVAGLSSDVSAPEMECRCERNAAAAKGCEQNRAEPRRTDGEEGRGGGGGERARSPRAHVLCRSEGGSRRTDREIHDNDNDDDDEDDDDDDDDRFGPTLWFVMSPPAGKNSVAWFYVSERS